MALQAVASAGLVVIIPFLAGMATYAVIDGIWRWLDRESFGLGL